MSLRTILVAVDGSTPALNATDLGADLAQRYDAALIILHVVAQRPTVRELKELAGYMRSEHRPITEDELLRSLGEKIVEAAADRARKKGAAKIETVVEVGDPTTAILAVAKARAADLIVTGRRGVGDLAALLIGSVSHKLIQLADRPCLVVG